MGYIEDMRNLVGNHPLILIGSHAIIVNEKNEILLQLRTDFNRWGIIGGALEYNETLEDALKREVYEETGLIIKNPKLFRTYSGPDFFSNLSKRRSSTRCTRCLYLP
ncbi:phosphohydrolase [Bacillus thuringiensis]|nr:phosphohydrolase [Bacillus thuringiensis]